MLQYGRRPRAGGLMTDITLISAYYMRGIFTGCFDAIMTHPALS
jgi:hypothetical protein